MPAPQQLRPLALAGTAPTKIRDTKSSQRRRFEPNLPGTRLSTEVYPVGRFGDEAVGKLPPMERRVDYVAPLRGDRLGQLQATAGKQSTAEEQASVGTRT